MENEKQFETLALIREYARKIAGTDAHDVRPSTAYKYRLTIVRMNELQKSLDCQH